MKRLIVMMTVCAVCLTITANRPKIGLALGGGGAKGAAEVGVLKVIEEAGIPIDYIAGTSIGSIVGGLYAAGYRAAELDTMFQTQEWLSLLTDRRADFSNDPYKEQDGVTYIFGFPVMDSKAKGVGMMRGERIEQVLDSMVARRGCTTFERLPIPFRCVAADIRTAEEVVLKKGKLANAMRASMAIPGIFKPVSKGDWLLVDGGMMNNLPVDVCREMGADIVIAIDLQQNEKKPRKATDTSFLSVLGGMLGIGSLLNWLAERPDVEKYLENVKQADIYIHPNLPDENATSFGNKSCARMIKVGEDTARKHWNELVRLKE